MFYFFQNKGKGFPIYAKKRLIGGIDVGFHSFLTLALDGGEWSGLLSGRFKPGKKAGDR